MQKLKDFFRFAFVALVIGLSVGYVLASSWSGPTGSPPTGNCTDADPTCSNTQTPINVGNLPNPQIKSGGLTINGPNSVLSSIFSSTNQLAIGPTAIASSDFGNPNSTIRLDVGGQIRIRGGGPNPGEVLKADDNTGLASWGGVSSLTRFEEGFGIDLGDYSGINKYDGQQTEKTYLPSVLTGSGIVSVWTGTVYNNPNTTVTPDDNRSGADVPNEMIQQRVNSYNGVFQTGCTSLNAITAIGQTGNANCSPFVTTVQAISGSGLTLSAGTPPLATQSATSGPITLAVSIGVANGGLSINGSNQLILNVNETANAGDGLTLGGGSSVKFESCGNNETWQYNTGTAKWACAAFPPATVTYPGESVMYLRSKNLPAGTYPANCPANWNAVPINTSGSTYTGNESVGNATNWNEMRACYRSDKSCQVIYLKAITYLATCPVSWTDTVGTTTEWSPNGSSLNYVRTCYLCH